MGVIESHKQVQHKPIRTSFCITYTARMEQSKNPGGRPPLPPDQVKEQRSLRLLPEHWAEYDALGGVEWLRATLAKAAARRRRTTKPAG
jgi:hypothetical protein